MKKILLIEDEKILGQMYLDKFREAGFEVVLASSAEEGIELIKKEKPDLVVLDMLLPRGNGLFFLREKNKIPEIALIPIVAFSNYDDPQTKREALNLGVKDYLIKTNYTPQQAIEKICESLTRKQ